MSDGECADCGHPFGQAKIVYDVALRHKSIELCPKCARLMASRMLLDCMRLEQGDKKVAEFWAKRRKIVIAKAEASLESGNWHDGATFYVHAEDKL